ncbi:MAG: sulfatase-like hydrolase/transferase [bacterium]|nr:sulfatase-like hydrolase/transferase [bacterium]
MRENSKPSQLRVSLLLSLYMAVSLTAGACSRGPERVLLVTIDTLRADRLGCYGREGAQTPTLDGIAAAGVRFETAISPTPMTLPSHTSLMTALDPPSHGVRHNSIFRLEENFPTLAEAMRAAGFETAAFLGAMVLERDFGLARGFDSYDDQMPPRWGQNQMQRAERSADAVVDEAIAWLEKAPDRFFLWVHLYDPHAKYEPPPEFAKAFPNDPYAGEIAFVDAELGRLLAHLNQRWPDQRTLVVATSDHGESLFDHDEPTHSYGIYDSTQRVPLLMQGPGLPRGQVVESVARLIDVAPTMLALSGAEPLPGATGISLLAQIEGTADSSPVTYLETLGTQLDMGWSPLLGIRTERHKYIRAPRPELYDLVHDPDETRNLAEDASGLVEEFDAILGAQLASGQPARPNLTPSGDQRARLESLGYVLSEEEPPSGALGVVGGIDPKDEIGAVAAWNEALSLIEGNRPAEALARLEGAGGGLAVQLARTEAALAAGDLIRAEREARAAIEAVPSAQSGYAHLGMVLLQQQRWAEAEKAFLEAVRLAPEQGFSLLGLGRLAEAQGRDAEAAEFYARSWEARAPEGQAAWRLAALRILQGRHEEADALLALFPDHELVRPEVAIRLSTALQRSGRLPDALERVWSSRRAHPRNVNIALAHGRLLEANGSLERALAVRERALTLAPKSVAARNDVAWSLTRLGRDLDRAFGLAEGATAQRGPLPELLDTLATVQLQRGDWERALELAQRGSEEAQGETRAHLLYVRAEALARGGRNQRAQEVLKQALDAAGQPPPFWHAAAMTLARKLEGGDETSPPREVTR